MENQQESALTGKELRKLEHTARKPIDYVISLLPIVALIIHMIEYLNVVNAGRNQSTNIYLVFLSVMLAALILWFVIGIFHEKTGDKLRYKAPFYTALALFLLVYDVLTLKTGILRLPYFPWVDRVLNAMIEDRVKLWDCLVHSLILLFTGYFGGVFVGLLCGICAGWSQKVSYWVEPVARVLGAIPATTYMPIVMMLAASLFGGAAFLIGLGVWFPVTVSSMTGVSTVRKQYYEAARTLGTKQAGLLLRVAIPMSMPNIFGGLTQGMSVACLTLVVAEMMGVEAGLGWYINWQKGWAEFAKMYGAIILICITFIAVNTLLGAVRAHVLRWQKGNI